MKAPGRVAPPSDAAVGVQLSKSGAGLRDLSNPAQTGRGNARPDKIFLLFPLRVKVTTGGVNQGWQGGMTTRGDKKHLRRFFGKDDSTMAPEGRWPDPELSLPSSLLLNFVFFLARLQ